MTGIVEYLCGPQAFPRILESTDKAVGLIHPIQERRLHIGTFHSPDSVVGATLLVLLPAVAILPVPRAQSASYPEKPIRLIVPFSAGGSADNLARVMQSAWSTALGASLVIDNRAGASSIIGTDIAAKAPPDGYTILLITTTHSTNASLIRKLPFDPVKDFSTVSLVASQPNLLCVHPAVAATTVKELVALAKNKPNAFNFASGGSGSSPHLAGELFNLVAGIQITHVPYKGTGPAAVDLVAGQVQMMFAGPLLLEPHVRSGRVRALAIADSRRTVVLPEIPTMAEAGVAGVESGTWYGILAPVAASRGVVAKLNQTLVPTIKSPEVAARLVKQGVEIAGTSPEEFQRYLTAEIAKWAKVIKQANIRADSL
jgi:tripartite-type tricarboxylate transporter receptor subunit TctC